MYVYNIHICINIAKRKSRVQAKKYNKSSEKVKMLKTLNFRYNTEM